MDYVSPHHRGKDVSTIMYAASVAPTPMPTPTLAAPRVSTDSRHSSLSDASNGFRWRFSRIVRRCPSASWSVASWNRCSMRRLWKSFSRNMLPAIYSRVGHRRSRQLAHPVFRWPPGVCVRCLHCRPGFDTTNDLHQLPGTLRQARTHGSQTQRSHRPVLRREAEAGSRKVAAPDAPILAGYRTQILDGNVLTGTDHRLTALRQWLNACLPGKSLVVFEPDLGLISDMVLCEDAYTQERALLTYILERVQARDLLVFDRNFTTTGFAFGIAERGGSFVGRQHRTNLPVQAVSKLVKCGETETGRIYEQIVRATDPDTGATLLLRRIEIRLFEKTRDGEKTIGLLTNLPATVSAVVIAEIYRKRWTIETQFQLLTVSLHCEVPGLGKPRAALFAFAMSLVASNALAVVRASLRAAHGKEAEAEVSGHYLADEIAAEYRTLAKYLPAEKWKGWRKLGAKEMASLLTEIARQVNMAELLRNQRGRRSLRTRSRFITESINTSRLTASWSRLSIHVERAGLHVLLSAGPNDTKQPCSVLAPFLAVVLFRWRRIGRNPRKARLIEAVKQNLPS